MVRNHETTRQRDYKTMSDFELLLKTRKLVLDGAMGTMILNEKLSSDDYLHGIVPEDGFDMQNIDKENITFNCDLLNISRPNIIANIHNCYLSAGADIITTNTFGANSISQEKYGLSHLVPCMNRNAIRIAKKSVSLFSTVERPRFIAGCLGPIDMKHIDNDVATNAYYEQIANLMFSDDGNRENSGCDVFIVESIMDLRCANCANEAIQRWNEENKMNVPAIFSAVLADEKGNLFSSETIDDFLSFANRIKPFGIGLNCSLGPKHLKRFIDKLCDSFDGIISFAPSLCLPNDDCNLYDIEFKDVMSDVCNLNNVKILGGCCGTTPKHINIIANLIST